MRERKLPGGFDATYLNYYVAHATIETHSACKFEKDQVTIWASTRDLSVPKKKCSGNRRPLSKSSDHHSLVGVDLAVKARTDRSLKQHALQNYQEDLFRLHGAGKKSSFTTPSGGSHCKNSIRSDRDGSDCFLELRYLF